MAISLGGCCIVDSSVRMEDIDSDPVKEWVEANRPEPGHLSVVESIPQDVQRWFDSRTEGLTVGGGAANAGMRLADLGVGTEIWGLVGDDNWGRFYRRALERRGIDVSRVQVTDKYPTSRTVVLEERDDRCFIHVLGANALLKPDHYQSSDSTWGDYLGYLYIFGNEWPGESGRHMAEILERMKNRKKIAMLATTADPNKIWDGAEPALRYADIFFCNEVEALGITREKDYRAAAEKLNKMGVRLVSITLGRNGSYAYRKTMSDQFSARARPAYDIPPTVRRAAGDSYAAGFMALCDMHVSAVGLAEGAESIPMNTACDYGNAVASLAVGGNQHINPEMVRRLVESRKFFYIPQQPDNTIG